MPRLKKIELVTFVAFLILVLNFCRIAVERSDYARSQIGLMAWEVGEMAGALSGTGEGNEDLTDTVYVNWTYLYSLQSNMNDRRLPWEEEISGIDPFDENRFRTVISDGVYMEPFERAIDILESDAKDPYSTIADALEELGAVI